MIAITALSALVLALGSAKAAVMPKPVLPNVPYGPVYTDEGLAGRRIHPFGRDDLCVSVIGSYMADQGVLSGQAVDIAYCFPNEHPYTHAQTWNIAPGAETGTISLSSFPNLCLDAGAGGSDPYSGGLMKVWSCGDNWPQQQWIQMDRDGKIITANNQCLDVQLGSQPGDQSPYPSQGTLQTWECFYDGNFNQAFHVL